MNPDDLNFDPDELRLLFAGDIPFGTDISFYLDESVDHRIASLWTAGIRVITVEQEGQKGEPSDIRVLAHARKLGAILVTNDPDFIRLHRIIQSIEGTHAGIIVIRTRLAKEKWPTVVETLLQLAEQVDYVPDMLENELLTL